MPKASNSMEMKTTSKRPLPQAAWIFGAAFLLLLAIMHLVKPELGPTWRMISEYEIGDFGWVMRLAFFCWAAGFLCLAISLWPLLETRGGKIGKWWLVIISIALLGAGTFATQPITDLARGTVDKLHSAFGAIMIFTFPIASTIIARQLFKLFQAGTAKKQLVWVTALVWLGFLAFFSTIIIYSDQAKTRAYGPEVLIGIPNRGMVVTYTVWLMTVARLVSKHLQRNNR
jgi:Protein of unknown function (DUF998)